MQGEGKYGMLVDYEYCIGCRACEVSCKQEHNLPVGKFGVRVFEHIDLLPEKPYISYFPFFTELCNLCRHRVKDGEKPSCVKHCMTFCLKFGLVDELVNELKKKPRQVLWVPE